MYLGVHNNFFLYNTIHFHHKTILFPPQGQQFHICSKGPHGHNSNALSFLPKLCGSKEEDFCKFLSLISDFFITLTIEIPKKGTIGSCGF